MTNCTIVLEDEVNIKLVGLDLVTRKKCVNSLKYFLPHARYSAAYRLGRWDGTTSFCTIGGRTYLNLLDKILPILEAANITIDIDDKRHQYDFQFENIDENCLGSI